MADKPEWDPNVGWAQNFRKFRWVYAILPAITPMAFIAVFLAGYATFGLAAIILSIFAWFDYRKHTKKKNGALLWSLVAVVSGVWGIYMLVLQFVPALRGDVSL
jgi:hypothetical protein